MEKSERVCKDFGFSIATVSEDELIYYPEPAGTFPSPKAPIGWLMGHVESYYDFLNCVSNETKSNPNFSDAAYVQSIMEAAYRSAENGCWVKI